MYSLFEQEDNAPAPAPAEESVEVTEEVETKNADKPLSAFPDMPDDIHLLGLNNLRETTISYRECRPWDWAADAPEDVQKSKESFGKWSIHPETKHLWYTGLEGLNGNLRITRDNPAVIVRAIVAEYDGHVTDENVALLGAKLGADLMPTFFHRSRFSGGGRLLWVLEKPLNISDEKLLTEFLHVAAKELKLARLLAGFDTESLSHKQFFEVGPPKSWERIGNPLSEGPIMRWLFEAGKRTKFKSETVTKIPMEEIEKAVHSQFPGRWTGPFEVGNRGVVFFDPTSTNPTAAYVVEEGMVCFGQPKAFYRWKEILGEKFIRNFEENALLKATNGIWYDGKNMWIRTNHGWIDYAPGDVELKIAHETDLKNEAIRAALYHIKFHRRVHAVRPFVGDHREIIGDDGDGKVLNSYIPQVVQPAMGGPTTWGDSFPWLQKFLESRSDPAYDPGNFQMWHLLAWLQHFYNGMREGRLSNGQAIAVAGGPTTGKTLFFDRVVGKAIGGALDATGFLQGTSDFDAHLFHSGLWLVDDGSFTVDARLRKYFTEMLKKCAAQTTFEYNQKFQRKSRIRWKGRVVILLNTDPESILAVPSLGASNADKVNLYRWVKESKDPFPSRTDLDEIIDRELPHFLRWLVHFDFTTVGVEKDPRFGIKSHADEKTRVDAERASGAGAFEELLAETFIQARQTTPIETSVSGLMASLMENPLYGKLATVYKIRHVASILREISSRKESPIKPLENGTWWIDPVAIVDSVRGHSASSSSTEGISVDLRDEKTDS